MQPKPLYQVIASTMDARARCLASGNLSARYMHEDILHDIERNLLPSGSGIDNGCKLELRDEYDGTFSLTSGFHHMDENGYYCGWTYHTLTVSPSLIAGFDLSLDDGLGDDADDTADYLYDVFNCDLAEVVEWDSERKCYRFAARTAPARESSDVPAVSTASAEEAFEGKGR